MTAAIDFAEAGTHVVKVCGVCGEPYSLQRWLTLRDVGRQHVGCDLGIGDGHGCLDLRDCTCGTTLAVDVDCLGGAS